jgi:proline iminopeptidase
MRAEVNGVRLYFDVEGARLVPDGGVMRERPTLLLLHGGPGFDGSMWRPEFSSLADVCQVIYLDQRGAGRSDRGPKDAWNFDQWADDVRAFCDALDIEKPIVCGVSFGGEVAMAYAGRHPGHPGKLIIMSAAPRLDVERIAAAFTRLGGERAGTVARDFWTHMTPENGAAYVRECIPLYAHTRDADRDARAITNGELTVHFLSAGGPAQTCDFREGLRRIASPTLVIGGEDDPVTPIEDMAEIASLIPPEFVRFERVAAAGHAPYMDAPERVLGVVREFVSGGVTP